MFDPRSMLNQQAQDYTELYHKLEAIKPNAVILTAIKPGPQASVAPYLNLVDHARRIMSKPCPNMSKQDKVLLVINETYLDQKQRALIESETCGKAPIRLGSKLELDA